MTFVFGALAQSTPAAATLTDAYTVPAGKRATVQAVVCNRGANTTVRLAHAPAGAANANGHYLLYDLPVSGGDTQSTARFTMAATDVVRVYAADATVTFNINGIEEDV